jgi:hypothetical protein
VFGVLGLWQSVHAATWQGLEPFKSKRADVLQALGKPISESPGGILSFKVAGGTVSVSFVDRKFVENKKLQPELEGTVLQIVLQHERSTDTPESLKLLTNPAFVHDEIKNASIFRNTKEGVVYTFIDSQLKTTRYTFSDAQLGHMRRAR